MPEFRDVYVRAAHSVAALVTDPMVSEQAEHALHLLISTLEDRHRVFVCGNGGSAADAQHFAAEFVGHFKSRKRAAFPVQSLTTDTSALTAIGNDDGYKHVFARQLEAYGTKGDLLIVMSTSGRSENILEAIGMAARLNMATIALTGNSGLPYGTSANVVIAVPSTETARIQEVHMFILHCMCEMFE